MSRLFLSHSSVDDREAAALKQWLGKQNPRLANEIFLDLDPGTGIHIGQRWRDALNQAATRCEGVVCLLSRHWETSEWCRWEYSYAAELGKRIFVALLQPGTGAELLEWQQCALFGDGPKTAIDIGDDDPVLFETEGLYRLRDGIRRSGIGSDSFEWPIDDPQRAPYRGWQPFEPVDAGIFCGRDAQIVAAMDALRSVRQAKTKHWFVILGPSGSGKSSFLRAGVIPRMQRDDRQFLVLGIMRPEREALLGASGFAASIYSARQDKGLATPTLEEIEAACADNSAEVRRLLLELQEAARLQFVGAGDNESPPTIVLPLDQAEELLSPDNAVSAHRFLRLAGELASPAEGTRLDMIVMATIRTDRFAGLQTRPEFAEIGTELFGELRPMPTQRFEEVITGPAERVTADGRPLELAPDLVDTLLADCAEGGDTLPLLALTLSLLYGKHSKTKQLTLSDYREMGGLRRVVQTVIDGILDKDPPSRRRQLQLLRDAFIPWLATVNPDTAQPMRRVARWDELPGPSRSLIDAFVTNRLLVKDRRDNENVVEVALESLLWQWDDLATWLNDAWRDLKAVDDLERAAAAWEHNSRHPDWLLAGSRLVDAESLASTRRFRGRLTGTLEYLRAGRLAELSETSSVQMVSSAQGMLAHTTSGGDARACKQLLAAQLLSRQFDRGVLYTAVVQLRTTLKIVEIKANGVAYSPDGKHLATANYDNTIRLWDCATGQQIGRPLTGHISIARSVAFSPDGQRLASSSDDKTVRLWDTMTGQQIGESLMGHTDWVLSVAFSPSGRHVASASRDKTARIWDLHHGREIGAPLSHAATVRSVAFSPDGLFLASSGDDHIARLWDARNGQPIGAPLAGHTDDVTGVAFSPDGRHLASGGSDKTVRLWDVSTAQQIGAPLTGHTGLGTQVAFNPDGQALVSTNTDGTVRIWDISPRTAPLSGHTAPVSTVAFSADGQHLASASADSTVRIWDPHNGLPLGPALTDRPVGASPDDFGIIGAAFRPDGHTLVSIDKNLLVQFWQTQTGQCVGRLHLRSGNVAGVAFSPDGQLLASAGTDSTVRLWDVGTGQQVGAALTGHSGWVAAVAFSADGSRLASCGSDKTLRLWDVGSGEQLGAPLTGHTDKVYGVAFSPDGHCLGSGGDDSTVRLWDAHTGEHIGAPLTGHTGGVLSVTFSPDGQHLASGSRDNTARLWDTRTGRPVGSPLSGHTSGVRSVAFSPNGRDLATGSWDGTVRLWPAVTRSDDLCQKLTANMSHQQWRQWVSPDIPYKTICPNLPIPADDSHDN